MRYLVALTVITVALLAAIVIVDRAHQDDDQGKWVIMQLLTVVAAPISILIGIVKNSAGREEIKDAIHNATGKVLDKVEEQKQALEENTATTNDTNNKIDKMAP